VIPKRVFWFGAGTATGFAGALYAYARVREVRGRFAADRIAGTLSDAVVGTTRSASAVVRGAVAEGREAVREAEERIRRDLDDRTAAG
jgi:hypothetical protein